MFYRQLLKNIYVNKSSIMDGNHLFIEDFITDIIYKGYSKWNIGNDSRVMGITFWARSKNKELYEIVFLMNSQYTINFDFYNLIDDSEDKMTSITLLNCLNTMRSDRNDRYSYFHIMNNADDTNVFYKIYFTERQIKLIKSALFCFSRLSIIHSQSMVPYRKTYDRVSSTDININSNCAEVLCANFHKSCISLIIKYNEYTYLLFTFGNKDIDTIKKKIKKNTIKKVSLTKLSFIFTKLKRDKYNTCITTTINEYTVFDIDGEIDYLLIYDHDNNKEYKFIRKDFEGLLSFL